ncbi:MAG: M28 family peptidase [Deltaproteobacteria bacterium]|nr:M28 family peptidase [Deltaproteobacteria bacterium]MBI3389538.1 M28 family peptidase [Deltaproteobacteria bacterium]
MRTLAREYFPRDARHPGNLDRTAVYIRSEFEQAQALVSEQAYDVDDTIYRNVIAVFGPESTDRIVIGAHYDAAGPLPGADDNASGVAGLIELAHLLGRVHLPRRVELVAYSLEEPPFFRTEHMGSTMHASALKSEGVRVRLMISLEMIGYFSDAPNSQEYPLALMRPFYPSRGDFVAVVGTLGEFFTVRRMRNAMRAATVLPVEWLSAPRVLSDIDLSDQMNYWEAGYDALMVTDTSFYRNKRYHTPADTPETLDYRRMALVVVGVYSAVVEFAE